MTENAYSFALRMLGQRSYTEYRLRRKLQQKEFPDLEVAAVMERLQAAGLINDVRYAESFARGKLGANAAVSPRHVTNSLVRRGINRKIAEQAVADVMEAECFDAGETISRAVAKKLRSVQHLEPTAARRRLYGFLVRRGFDLREIRSTLNSLKLTD